MNVSTDFVNQSIFLTKNLRGGLILSLILCIISVMTGSMQMVVMLVWKPLRHIDQSLILFIAVTDILKAFLVMISLIQRLYLIATGQPGIISQRECMFWLFPGYTGMFIIEASMLAISAERMLSLSFPIWFSTNVMVITKIMPRSIFIKICAIIFSIVVGLVFGLALFIDSSNDNIQMVCAAVTSPAPIVRSVISHGENVLCAGAVLVNGISCVVVFKRWRRAKRSSAQEIVKFKCDAQLNALKTLLIVVLLFIVSVYAGTVYVIILNRISMSDSTRLSYAPFGGAVVHVRGTLDFWIFVFMCKEYRNGFRAVLGKCGLNWKKMTTTVVPFNS